MRSLGRDTSMKALYSRQVLLNMGRPTAKNVNKSLSEITAEYVKAKNTHSRSPLGSKFGFAAAIHKKEKFIQLHNNVAATIGDVGEFSENWEFVYPTCPDSYDDAITGSMLNFIQRRREAAQAEILTHLEIF